MTSRIRLIVHSASFQVEPNVVLPMSTVIWLVRVLMGAVKLVGSTGALPITICTASASPAARVMPSTTAVARDVTLAGRSRCRIVCQRVVPRASDAVRHSSGTARRASYETLVMVGRIITVRTSDPANQLKPVSKPSQPRFIRNHGTRTVRPIHPYTTLGIDGGQERRPGAQPGLHCARGRRHSRLRSVKR